MKKKIYLLVLLGSLFFLGACTNEEIAEFEVLHQEEGLVSFEAGFQPMLGRTILEEGGKVKWSAGDEIVLFDASVSARYVAIAGGSSTLFILKDGEKALDPNGSYTAFYPADRFDVTKRSFSVKQVQQAVSGSFDPDAALCMATVTNRDYVTFRNLCTLMKVNVPQAAIDGGVAAMNLSAPAFIVSGGTLASDGSLNWNQTIKNFRMEGSFEYGKDYYLVIPPQTFQQGFTLAMNNGSNATIKNCARTKSSTATFEVSKNYAMGTIFEVEVDNSWYEEVVENTPEATEFEVSTPEQFVSFVQMMNGMQARSASEVDFEGKTIKLESDLDFTYYNDAISPIKNFKGSFDGQGHVIKNLKIVSDEQFVGLFASLEKGQTFQNLTLQGGKIVSTYSGNGNGYVGSVLGYTYGGTVINCHNLGCEVLGQGPNHVSGVVGGTYLNCGATVMACSNTAHIVSDIDKTVYVGGITSRWGGAIRMVACYNEGTIEVKNCSQPYAYAGGLSGDFGGYNYMYGCFNSGSVKGLDLVGSLAGFSSYSAYIYNSCYADGDGLPDLGEDWSTNKYNVSRSSYSKAVGILNVGIEYYNQKESIPCTYRFVTGSKPALEVVENGDGTGTPGLGEGEIF